jgi:hypothetical protein
MILMEQKATVQVNIEAGNVYYLHDWDSRAYEEVTVVGIAKYEEVNGSCIAQFGLTHPTVLEYLKSTQWVYYSYWKEREGLDYTYLPIHEFIARSSEQPKF